MNLYAVRHKEKNKLMRAAGYPARTTVGGKLYKQRYWAERLFRSITTPRYVSGDLEYYVPSRYKPEELEIVCFNLLEVLDEEEWLKYVTAR